MCIKICQKLQKTLGNNYSIWLRARLRVLFVLGLGFMVRVGVRITVRNLGIAFKVSV